MTSLAENCDVSTGDVSIIFTYRAFGVFFAACLAGAFFPGLGQGLLHVSSFAQAV
jgi:hypothetical protein